MVYGVKYRAEWRATTRGVRDYKLEILEDGYTGSVSPIYLTGDCIAITYGAVDEGELQPIKSSEAEITILCMESGDPYIKLYTLDPAQYKVVIYEGETPIWKGYLATGSYQQPLSKPPYTVRFRANDGLGILKAMPYLDSNGDRYLDSISVSELFQRLLSPITDTVNVWNYMPLKPFQDSPTFDIVSIPGDSIYDVFGDETPSYYDVLEAVLSNFGVQAFQHNSVWCIRTLEALENAYSNGEVPAVYIENDPDYGLGLKSDATLSVLAPLGKMTSPEHRTSAEADLSDYLSEPDNWQLTGMSQGNIPKVSRYGKAIYLSTPRTTVEKQIQGCAVLPLPIIFPRTNNAKLTLSFDIHNLNNIETQGLVVGVWIVAPSLNTDEVVYWEGSTLRFRRATYFWGEDKNNPSNSKWVPLTNVATAYSSQIGLQKVSIEKATRISSRPAISTLPKTSLSFEFTNLPKFSATSTAWQFVVAISTDSIDYLTTNFVCVSNIKFSINGDDAESVENNDVSICENSFENATYDVRWRTHAGGRLSNTVLMPMLADSSREGHRVHGYVTTSSGVADTDAVGNMLFQLRNTATYTIDGELDNNYIGHGVNNVCRYDSRTFYTNYVKRHLKRGVTTVQLREFPQLRKSSWEWSKTNTIMAGPRELVGVNHFLFFIDRQNQFGHVDLFENITTNIRTTSVNASICRGVDCVVLRDSSYVAAYDVHGKKLSEITSFGDSVIDSAAFYETAKYDATQEVWLASNKNANVIMCDKEGFVLARWECTKHTQNSIIADTEVLLYHGGFIYRLYSDSDSKYYHYWHCYAIHLAGEFETPNFAMSNNGSVRFLSDGLIVERSTSGQFNVSCITGEDLTNDVPTLSTMSVNNEVIDANNAILITRSSSSIAIYDCRNAADKKWYTLGILPSMVALCGDYLVTAPLGNSPTFTVRKIHPKISSLTPSNISMSNEQETNYSRREAKNLYQDVTDGGNPIDE